MRYNDNSIETKFIKNLLASTYVPTVPFWKVGQPVVPGSLYVTKNYILKVRDYAELESAGIRSYYPTSETDTTYFSSIEQYIPGKFYKGVTTNYVSNTSIYDSMTHYFLGLYLRFLRDVKGIDLMSYYNCWDGTFSDRLRIVKHTTDLGTAFDIVNNNTISDNKRVFVVPIRFDTPYTIYFNSSAPITITSLFYNKNRPIPNTTTYNTKEINYCSFSQPIKYMADSTSAAWGQIVYGEYLSLVIQVPSNVSSNLVVIEGDMKKQLGLDGKLSQTIYGDSIETLKHVEEYCECYPSILNSISTPKPFSDKLLGHLLLNTIDTEETIDKNIERVQKYITSENSLTFNKMRYTANYIKGVWNDTMRLFLYDIATKTPRNPQVMDTLGYVDKDTESIIMRGWNE